MVIKILIILISILIFTILLIGLLTEYLCTKPKSNKFRQWWNNHIVDMDDNYSN